MLALCWAFALAVSLLYLACSWATITTAIMMLITVLIIIVLSVSIALNDFDCDNRLTSSGIGSSLNEVFSLNGRIMKENVPLLDSNSLFIKSITNDRDETPITKRLA